MRLRFLPPCSLRPSLALFLAASLLSSIPVIGRPMDLHLQDSPNIHHYEISLSEALIDTGTEEKLGTGIVYLSINGERIMPRSLKDYKGHDALFASENKRDTIIGYLEINLKTGLTEEEIFRQATDHAKAVRSHAKDLGSINDWNYLTSFLEKFSSYAENMSKDSVMNLWKEVVDHALSVKAGDEIAWIEYTRRYKAPRLRAPSAAMEAALSVAGTVIFHSKPVNPQKRFARKQVIGEIKSGVPDLKLEELYDHAVENHDFQSGDDESEKIMIQEWLAAEQEWKDDYYQRERERPKERRAWKDLTDWQIPGEGCVDELNKKGYLTDEALAKWRRIRNTDLPAYINTVRRDKAVANARKPKEGSELNQDAGSSTQGTGVGGDSRRGRGKKPRAA
ncbi:hypothetical protein FB446DRAFT_540650 [Lentinula raphanica]|nr:hypothetical protein FB446DRAFT_540650 [Lentinula raphanica]